MRRARKFAQLSATICGSGAPVVYALADDGTAWCCVGGVAKPQWEQLPALPPPPACGSNVDRGGDTHVCELAAGHSGLHTDGGREW